MRPQGAGSVIGSDNVAAVNAAGAIRLARLRARLSKRAPARRASARVSQAPAMTTLVEMVLALDATLRSARIPHAFGGALALAFHIAEPRGTRDIDLNCFVPATDARTVFEHLPPLIVWGAEDVATVERDGQVRVFWGETPVDLFFSTHPFHE